MSKRMREAAIELGLPMPEDPVVHELSDILPSEKKKCNGVLTNKQLAELTEDVQEAYRANYLWPWPDHDKPHAVILCDALTRAITERNDLRAYSKGLFMACDSLRKKLEDV